jgi:hypothetical protein
MSNPILKPNDPRFARPVILDGAGNNRFCDPEQAAEGAPKSPAGIFYASPAASDQPYEPRYEQTAPSRGAWLLVLACIGLAGVGAGAASFSGLAITGWIFPLCGIVASATAWLLAHSDLREMRLGGRDPSGWVMTQVAMWLGVAGLLACLASVVGMIWLGLSLLPSLL